MARRRGARSQPTEIKIAVVRLVRSGVPQVTVASALGLHQSTVSRWWRQARRGGANALMRRPVPGRPRKLPEREVRRLAARLTPGPAAHGFDRRRWTLALIAEVIQGTYGVSYHPGHVGRLLRNSGVAYDSLMRTPQTFKYAPGGSKRMVQKDETSSPTFRLFKAIETGDTEAAAKLLAEEPRLVNARNKDGASALILATYYQRKPIADLLLARGAKPDIFEASAVGLQGRVAELLRADRGLVGQYSYDGWTPLHLAAHFGHLEVMRTLLAQGADHRAISRNSNRNQPLQAACAGRRTAAVELLLRAGAEVDARSHAGATALHIAAQKGDPGLVDMLLKAGADVNAKTEGGMTPLSFAIKGDHGKVVDILEGAGATA